MFVCFQQSKPNSIEPFLNVIVMLEALFHLHIFPMCFSSPAFPADNAEVSVKWPPPPPPCCACQLAPLILQLAGRELGQLFSSLLLDPLGQLILGREIKDLNTLQNLIIYSFYWVASRKKWGFCLLTHCILAAVLLFFSALFLAWDIISTFGRKHLGKGFYCTIFSLNSPACCFL